MYSFEGDFRSRPQQSFGGASRKLARDELLQQVAEERRSRENSRRKLLAVTTIQAFFRGTLTRIQEKTKHRKAFDDTQLLLDQSKLCESSELLKPLLQQLVSFYSPNCDAQRLTWLSQLYLKKSHLLSESIALESNEHLYRIVNLLQLNISALVSAVEQVPVAVPLRLLEVFTDPKTYICSTVTSQAVEQFLHKLWTSLSRKGYYRHLKTVLESRVPDTLEPSSRPPTLLAQSLFNLFVRPLKLGGNQMFRVFMIRALLSDVLSEPLSPQVSSFLLPALSEQNEFLPLVDLLAALNNTNVVFSRPNSCQLAITPTVWLLYSFLTLTCKKIVFLKGDIVVDYLQTLQCLAPTVQVLKDQAYAAESFGEISDDDERIDNTMETENDLQTVVENSLAYLNDPQLINAFSCAIEDPSLNEQCLVSVCSVCYTLLIHQRLAIHTFRLLYTLAFKPDFLRLLWKTIQQSTTISVLGAPIPLMHVLSRGIQMTPGDRDFFLPQLIVFCALFGHLLPTLHDKEFYKEDTENGGNLWVLNQNTMPFKLEELAEMSLSLRDICLGWIEMAYPDTRPSLNADYRHAMQKNAGRTQNGILPDSEIGMWLRLFKETTGLLSQLYVRDTRRQFCPDNHWIARNIYMPVDKPCDLQLGSARLQSYKPFMGVRSITREQLEEEGPPISIITVRYLKILQELPFVVSFPTRVKIFQALITKDKQDNQGEMYNFMMGPLIQILIRRNYIYEDAFEKLSPENEPNIKLRMRIQLVNVVGLDEAGIDGGGIFREFLSELLKTAFDPNRGFFKTTLDRLLYPNPGVALLMDNFPKHYYFIGRMLGKAIYENMLVELPFAGFFLSKMLGRHSGDVDIHHLASLDPVMYRNLLYLKTYEGDVSELGLDFTVMNSELGENQIVDLKENGSAIPVTGYNRIEYIHLVADYKLNKQIRAQCIAFKQGLANVIDLEWLRMFDPRELQVLISGAHMPVDVSDLKTHTNYAGGYTADHPVIKTFWKVVENFTEKQRRQLLKFVTSCSRPPLLGFKELAPAFCIQNAGSEPDRLPTASTCMNLLKLPEFQDEKTLKAKLLYAIESGAGFELS